MTTTVVVMGVSGSGKTRIGAALADRIGWPFIDADDLHPAANIAKMRSGEPLTEADRVPWLAALNRAILTHQRNGDDVVVACSALRRAYRDHLGRGVDDLRVVHLDVSPEVVAARLRARREHFMPPELLESQFAELEPPDPSNGPTTGTHTGHIRIGDSQTSDSQTSDTRTSDAQTSDAQTSDGENRDPSRNTRTSNGKDDDETGTSRSSEDRTVDVRVIDASQPVDSIVEEVAEMVMGSAPNPVHRSATEAGPSIGDAQ